MTVSNPSISLHTRNKAQASDLLFTLPFIAFFLIQLAHHQLWGDETNAWALSAASPNLTTLLNYVHHEGHPALWYVVLWLPARFLSMPVPAIKLIEGLLGIAIYLVIGIWSPFSRLEKTFLFLNYFVSFEYTVLSRMYSMTVLTLLIYLYRRTKYPEQTRWNAALLGLLANTDVLGSILSGALLLEYAFSEWRSDKRVFEQTRTAQAAFLYLALAAFAVWSGLPLSPVSVHSVDPFGIHRFELWHATLAVRQVIVEPWRPIRGDFPPHFWNPTLRATMIVLVPVVLWAYYRIFKFDWGAWIVIGCTTVAAILFNHLIYMGSSRHFGISFLAFLAALWLLRYRRPAIPPTARVLLAFGAAAGLIAAVGQWLGPFSNTPAAAQWLRAHHLENATLVGAYDSGTAPIAENLQRPMYFLDCNCSNTFVLFSPERDAFQTWEIPDRLGLALDRLHSAHVVFLTPFELSSKDLARMKELGIAAVPLAQFTGAEVQIENAFIYRVLKN